MSSDIDLAKTLHLDIIKLKKEISKVVYGQEETIELLITALIANGHALLVGVPGLAKTLLISTLAKTLNLSFNRIQFTPDLMPADITGFDMIQDDPADKKRYFQFVKGPIFTNILLADEINRTPPKTQAALLQAMQEYEVTASGHTYNLSAPFLVFATQNPIEQEGTYILPEAQQDRFMFNIPVTYPTLEQEVEIALNTTISKDDNISPILNPETVLTYQKLARKVPISEEIVKYAAKLSHFSRPETSPIQEVKEYVSWGAGPRGTQYLIIAAKARALINGHYHVSKEDIKYLAKTVLNHRIIINYKGEANHVDSFQIIEKIVAFTDSCN